MPVFLAGLWDAGSKESRSTFGYSDSHVGMLPMRRPCDWAVGKPILKEAAKKPKAQAASTTPCATSDWKWQAKESRMHLSLQDRGPRGHQHPEDGLCAGCVSAHAPSGTERLCRLLANSVTSFLWLLRFCKLQSPV